MPFDIDEKIRQLRDKLQKKKNDEIYIQMPKWVQYIEQGLLELDLKQLEAIKNRKFHVIMKVQVDCEIFGSKDFEIAEFDLQDDQTVQAALKDFMRRENEKKNSSLT